MIASIFTGALCTFIGLVFSIVSIQSSQVEVINKTCNANGGVEKVIATWFYVDVYCKDGAKFTLKD